MIGKKEQSKGQLSRKNNSKSTFLWRFVIGAEVIGIVALVCFGFVGVTQSQDELSGIKIQLNKVQRIESDLASQVEEASAQNSALTSKVSSLNSDISKAKNPVSTTSPDKASSSNAASSSKSSGSSSSSTKSSGTNGMSDKEYWERKARLEAAKDELRADGWGYYE